MAGVTENDVAVLFGTLVADLRNKLEEGTATGKDKEIVMDIVKKFNIGLTLEEAEPLDALNEPLPFEQMYPTV